MEHWIVVADSASCRAYRSDEHLEQFTPVLELTNDAVHPDPANLGPRGSTQSAPGGSHSAFERHTDPQDAQRARFAHLVATRVDLARAEGAFERLVLAAPPKFLGDLRGALGAATLERLVTSIHHDYTKTAAAELPALIRKHVTA